MQSTIQLQVRLTEPQAETLRRRVAALPFKVKYQEEQQGPNLIGLLRCTPPQEIFVREILHDVGATDEGAAFLRSVLEGAPTNPR
jgi:hypothetical protein